VGLWCLTPLSKNISVYRTIYKNPLLCVCHLIRFSFCRETFFLVTAMT